MQMFASFQSTAPLQIPTNVEKQLMEVLQRYQSALGVFSDQSHQVPWTFREPAGTADPTQIQGWLHVID